MSLIALFSIICIFNRSQVIKFASEYEKPDADRPTTWWEYGVQSEQCNVVAAEWGQWKNWGGCTASCDGGDQLVALIG